MSAPPPVPDPHRAAAPRTARPSAPPGESGCTLLLVRHAKAVPKGTVEDFDRPLSDRGRADASQAGRWLAESPFHAELALCSPARRTRQTWQLAEPALRSGRPPTIYDERLYDATPNELVAVLEERGPGHGSVVMVGHNSGIHELAAALCGEGPQEELDRLRARFPTAGVVAVYLPDGWGSVAPGRGSLAAFWVPDR
ncbi:SixA phosphatase family protein [Streptomyces sp. NPDC058701]|uniref:SixA phosphatase family protein n=1 Tax=Streptomyces sp. NPDC058701 TaxID=3346608 RepID=UPI00364D16F6